MALQHYLLLSLVALASGRVLQPRAACPSEDEPFPGFDLVVSIREQIINDNVDPYPIGPLPDQFIFFKYLFQQHNGTLSLTDGFLLGFSSLELIGDVVTSCQDGVTDVTLPVIIPSWVTTYSYKLDADRFKPSGFMTADSDGLRAEIKLTLDANKGVATFQSFKITVRPSTTLSFTSMGVIESSVMQPILTVYTQNLFDLIVAEFQTAVKTVIDNLPVEGPTSTTSSTTSTSTTTSTTPEPTTSTTTTSTSTTPAPTTSSSTSTTTTSSPSSFPTTLDPSATPTEPSNTTTSYDFSTNTTPSFPPSK